MPDEDANRPVIVHWGSRDAEPSDLWLATFTATDGSPWRREIDDPPSAESKLYQLPQVVLFAILALR